MFTTALTAETFFSATSKRLYHADSRDPEVFFLMWTHSFLTTSERGIGPPATSARSSLTCIGFINAELLSP